MIKLFDQLDLLHFFWFLEDRQLCEDYEFTTMVETSDKEEGKENDDPPGKSLEIVVGQVCFFCLHVQGLNQKEMSMEVATIDMLHTGTHTIIHSLIYTNSVVYYTS